MSHRLFADASFWRFLLAVDRDLAAGVQAEGCSCGGRLHQSNYLRKPRGVDLAVIPTEARQRLSFCCDREACRKRSLPPSARFLGRKVYLGAIVVLVTAMRQGASPYARARLEALFDADRRTIDRWRTFWQEEFPLTAFWKEARARFSAEILDAPLPLALLRAFFGRDEPGDQPGDEVREGWQRLLRFLSPITSRRPS